MNLDRLKTAEEDFLARYPEGFAHPDMVAMGKKHKMEKMVGFAQEQFAANRFDAPSDIVDSMSKIVSRSSMVSMFEKPKFRDFANALDDGQRDVLVGGLESVLHGDQEEGFEAVLEVLTDKKLAKWPLMTVCQSYFRPNEEVFIKPTTAKGVIEYFELEGLQYKAKPSWAFYNDYRAAINAMKAEVSSSLAPNNAAFCGFLMISFKGLDSCGS